MSYIYLQEQGEESLADSYLDIPQYVRSKLKNTQDKSYCSDNETESCQNFQSGTTFAHSTVDRGADQLTFFVGDSHVKTSVQQEKELEYLAKGRVYGKSICDLFQRFNQPIFLQKTHLCCESVDLKSYCVTLPNWGIMQDGVCLDIGILEDRRIEIECGYVPAPVKNMGEGFIGGPIRKSETWGSTSRQDHWLIGIWKKWTQRENGANSREKLIAHPTFSAWTMGWPKNWTNLKPLEMGKFHKWLRQHSEFYHKD